MNGTTLWPQSPTTGNYRDIFVGTGLLRSFFNSVLYTVTGTLSACSSPRPWRMG